MLNEWDMQVRELTFDNGINAMERDLDRLGRLAIDVDLVKHYVESDSYITKGYRSAIVDIAISYGYDLYFEGELLE